MLPNRLDLIFIAAIEDAQIKVAARVIDGRVVVICVENTVDDQVRKGEE